MNKTNQVKKKWLVLIVALLMLVFTVKDLDISEMQNLEVANFLPLLVLTAIIFLLKTSVLSIILVTLQKVWKRLVKKSE